MGQKRVIILGAGLAGLSAAWHLQKKGIECIIFEKEKEAGGLCRSKNINGFTFDYSGHLLHFKHKWTFNFVKDLLGNNLARHKRNSWVYSHNRYIRYPFQANFFRLPASVAKECLAGFVQASKNNHCKKSGNFLGWINQTFGEGIARHFMIPYNTKFWTVSPDKLTCEWLDGFVPVPSLSQIIDRTIRESEEQIGYNAYFWYPKKGGIGQLALALAGQIKHIYPMCPVTEIDLDKKKIRINGGCKERFDYLISTVPLPELPHIIKEIPKPLPPLFKKLKWNSIFNLNLGIKNNDNLRRHWIYFPQKELSFFRIGFPHNISDCLTPQDKNSLYIEVTYSKEMPIDKNKIAIRIKEDLKKIGILRNEKDICCQDINDIKYSYPIYDTNYSFLRNKILSFLLKNDIVSCGRYGGWRYISIEGAIIDGKNATNCIT